MRTHRNFKLLLRQCKLKSRRERGELVLLFEIANMKRYLFSRVLITIKQWSCCHDEPSNSAGKLQSGCHEIASSYDKLETIKELFKGSHTAISLLEQLRLPSPSFWFKLFPYKLQSYALPSHTRTQHIFTEFFEKYLANNSIIIEPLVSFLHYSHLNGWL